jgi:hypothetical protein
MATTASSLAPAISCEKCHQGQMQATKVRRMSGGLVFVGYALWIPALLVMLLTGACTVAGLGAGGVGAGQTVSAAKQRATTELHKIDGITPDMISEFVEKSTLSEASLRQLNTFDRRDAQAVLSTFYSSVGGSAIGGTIAAGVGMIFVGLIYVLCIPLFIVGLLLTLKKRVWRCPTCGYVFERAP